MAYFCTMDKENTIKRKLYDLRLFISWREISRAYFNKSASWIYDRMEGRDGIKFTEVELCQMKRALCDLADRLRNAADEL